MAKVLIKSFCHNLATLVLLGPLMAIKILNFKCTVHLTILPCPLVLYPILPISNDHSFKGILLLYFPFTMHLIVSPCPFIPVHPSDSHDPYHLSPFNSLLTLTLLQALHPFSLVIHDRAHRASPLGSMRLPVLDGTLVDPDLA